MKFYGQLEKASFEVLASDPSQGVQGRFWFNSTSLKVKNDDGTNIRAMLRNDQACVFGNSGTASSNVRFNRAAASVLQFVPGDDTTAEGSLSTSLAQLSFRLENYTTVGRPAFGNAGRLYFDTTAGGVVMDTGAAWASIALANPMTTGGDIIYGGASGVPTRLANGTSGQVLTSAGSTSAPTWGFPGFNYTAQTTTYGASINDFILASGASFTITLPTAVGNAGKTIAILHNGTSLTQVYTLNTTSAQTIGGIASGSYILYTNGESLRLVSDGANWQVLNHKATTSWSATATTNVTGSGSNPTKPTTMIADKIIWRREGSTMYVHIAMYANSTTGAAAGSGTYLWLVPGSQTVNTTDQVTYNTSTINANNQQQAASAIFGSGWIMSSIRGALIPQMWDSTHFAFFNPNSTTVEMVDSSGDNAFNAASAWGMGADVAFQISGWQP